MCRSCGKVNPDVANLCSFCAARLQDDAPSQELRKTVTVVFCDLTESTAMGENLDSETVRRLMARYFDAMRTVLESHGGTVEKFIGDAIMAVFGLPQAHEDDALRAVRAAEEMRERLHDLNKELERDFGVTISSRIGVNTGEVVAGSGGQTLATGDAVNVAARLEQAAHPNEILIGRLTQDLVRDAVNTEDVESLDVKGKTDRVAAFRLTSVDGIQGIARRFDLPMVGRTEELQILLDAYQRAVNDSTCVLVTLLGVAGVGKSRLTLEFLEREGLGASLMGGRCLPYGDGITYWPIVEMLTAASGIAELDRPEDALAKLIALLGDSPDAPAVAGRLGQLLGIAGAAASPEETHWAVRKFFESVAGRRPLIVAFEDVHSAEPALLDLIEHIADHSMAQPILLLCSARPELLEVRPDWGDGKPHATCLSLGPLDQAECDQLIANLVERAELREEARRRITTAAEGNPLFVEHMVGMLIDDGTLRREGDRWTVAGDIAEISMPPSISALLEARLDRLSSGERATVERASIEGKVFHVGSVSALSPPAERAGVPEHLRALSQRDLIRPDRSLFAGDRAFRFAHILVRDAAYRSTLKERRTELHALHAEWLERSAGDRLAEFEEIVGYHLEQAYRLRTELRPPDEQARDLAIRAADRLTASGSRARERGDVGACAKLLRRAAALYPEETQARLEILPGLAEVLFDSGEIDQATQVIEDALRGARAAGDVRMECRAVVSGEWIRSLTQAPGFSMESSLSQLEGLIPILEELDDAGGLANAWTHIAAFRWWLGRTLPAQLALENALQYDGIGDEVGRSREALAMYAATYMVSFVPISVAIHKVDEIRDRALGNMAIVAFCCAPLALFAAMQGRFDDARRYMAEEKTTLDELGMAVWLHGASMDEGQIELMAGNPTAAERVLRTGYEALRTMGEKGFFSGVASFLALALAQQGRDAEAAEVVVEARDATSQEDFSSQVQWRLALAEVRVHEARFDEAEDLVREAVAIAGPTDWLDGRADTLAMLGRVLAASGKSSEARGVAREALELYVERENLVGAERTRRFLLDLGDDRD